jgi:heme/copper-type cytochrome/quinol oxidase subunit 2
LKADRRNDGRIVGVATIVLVLVALMVPIPIKAGAPQERHLTVSARSFAFEPGTVRVNRGDTVTIRLEATDVVHGLYVDGYGVSAQAEPGRPAELTFVADRAGAFRMRCSISCGSLHPFMIGKLVVGPNLTWLRAAVATMIAAVGAVVVFWNHGAGNRGQEAGTRNQSS